MLKVISLMRRADGLSKEEFLTWITEEHVKFSREIPGLRKFVVNVTDPSAETPYDCINELYFDDEEARAAGLGSPQGKASGHDAAAHTSERVHIITSARELV